MPRTAKLFRNGRSQAVRLPSDCRFEGSEVYIRRDASTGDVILSRKPQSWDEVFDLVDKLGVPKGFPGKRDNRRAQKRKLF
jgi:antitoxin VapB